MAKSAKTNRPHVVVAGPGAGKTHNMVNEIAGCIPLLQHGRFLAAITYTNAAAQVIRTRLHRVCQPSHSIFVGTIHGFLNRFILGPFAAVLDRIPEDPVFMAVDSDILDRRSGKRLTGRNRSIVRSKIYAAMVKKGVVPYDQMSSIAATLVEQSNVRRLVGHRLQFLFVDEFQDVDTTQHRVFDGLRKEGRTQIYVVGDPEQYISSFTYRVRSTKAPEFTNIPFFRFADNAQCSQLEQNHRSCTEIVTFTNHFHSKLTQESRRGDRGCQRVVFVSENDLARIVERFRQITDNWHRGNNPITRLYLGFANSTFDECRERFGLVPVSNSGAAQNSLLAEALEVVARLLRMSQRKARKTFSLDILEWRKIGLGVLKEMRAGTIRDQARLAAFLRKAIPEVDIDEDRTDGDAEMQLLLDAVLHNTERTDTERVASIHKAKGLEADGVLVVAKTATEIRKWCETDPEARKADKNDSCRVGFVAFSRARESLVLACLKELDQETKEHLLSLGIAFD